MYARLGVSSLHSHLFRIFLVLYWALFGCGFFGLAQGASSAYGPDPYAAAPYPMPQEPMPREQTYGLEEIVQTGSTFFGAVSGGLASVIERAFAQYGAPNAYILGEEASASLLAGARYGEGKLYMRGREPLLVFWQGPSLGWDFGGDGARVMTLIYHLPAAQSIFQRFPGVNGSAYLMGGFGMTVMGRDGIVLVPVRAGVGLRLGANVGYLKITKAPTWNPF